MRKRISGLVLVIGAALLQPMLAAAECAVDAAQSSGRIGYALWHYHAFDTPSSADRPAIVRVATDGSIGRGFHDRHFGPMIDFGDRGSMPAHKAREELLERGSAWADLGTLRSSGTGSASGEEDKESGSPGTIPIPEPDNWAMLIAGLLGMWTVARRRIPSI